MQHNKESDYSPPSRFSDPDSGRKESPNNWLYQSSENVLLVAKHHEGAQGVPPKDTPLPMKELFVIGCIFMSEVFSSSMLFPFVAFMVEDFGITDNKSDIGYYAGALASCFSFAQFISSFFWGSWSDKVGRKRVLMIGMAGSAIAITLFGLSLNYFWALAARSVHGLLNGNLGVARSFVGDITDSTNQARAMSYISLIVSIGITVGPSVGGFLSQPVDKYPYFFWDGSPHASFFLKFPYFLPCFVGAMVSGIGMLAGHIYLRDQQKHAKVISEEDSQELKLRVKGYQTITVDGEDIENKKPTDYQGEAKKTRYPKQLVELIDLFSYRELMVCTASYVLLTFSVLVFVEVFSFWSITEPEKGGLGFSSNDIGLSLSVVGLTIMVFQLLLYPRMEKIFGSLLLFRIGMAILVPMFLIFPMLNMIVEYGQVWVWLGVIFASIMRAMGATICFTSVFTLINDSVPSAQRGAGNGLSESAASLTKAVGPVSGGVIFAWSAGNVLLSFKLGKTSNNTQAAEEEETQRLLG